MPKQSIRLIHWNAAEAREKAERIRAAGYRVSYGPFAGPESMKALRAEPPDAVVIDLSRLPSQGRDIGLWLRSAKATRSVPLVFVGGEAEKVERTRKLLPDAEYATWRGIRGALKRALQRWAADPVVPDSLLAGYSGTPLPKKLGIKDASVVVLAGAPKGFEKTLGKLPPGVTFKRQARGRCDLVIWFPKSAKDLKARVRQMRKLIGDGGLWIAWPKQASGVKTDLNGNLVRKTGLDNGLVDYKVCAIDETYSGLKFARRRI